MEHAEGDGVRLQDDLASLDTGQREAGKRLLQHNFVRCAEIVRC